MTPYELGQWGEELATQHLIEQNYTVLSRNFRFKKAEIDIIAFKDGYLVVCEVKTRTKNKIQKPYQAVNYKKQQHIIEAINYYIQLNQLDVDVQFDIVSITHDSTCTQIQHISDAFSPLQHVA